METNQSIKIHCDLAYYGEQVPSVRSLADFFDGIYNWRLIDKKEDPTTAARTAVHATMLELCKIGLNIYINRLDISAQIAVLFNHFGEMANGRPFYIELFLDGALPTNNSLGINSIAWAQACSYEQNTVMECAAAISGMVFTAAANKMQAIVKIIYRSSDGGYTQCGYNFYPDSDMNLPYKFNLSTQSELVNLPKLINLDISHNEMWWDQNKFNETILEHKNGIRYFIGEFAGDDGKLHPKYPDLDYIYQDTSN